MKLFQASLLDAYASSIARIAGKAMPWPQGKHVVGETTPFRLTQNQVKFHVGDNSYLGIRHNVDLPEITNVQGSLLTVVPPRQRDVDHEEWIRFVLDATHNKDDVLDTDFLLNVFYETTPKLNLQERMSIVEIIKSYNAHASLIDIDPSQGQPLHPGPYVVDDGSLWQVTRLQNDSQGAFMVALEPHLGPRETSFQQLYTLGGRYQVLGLAVPSRLSKRSDGPLKGMRFAVKDMFSVHGIAVTLCNRAYYDISPPSQITAPVIQNLLDAGASLVGTTKLSSMLSREEPTEAVDYPQPFNPRADGYQSPAGSSSGSAVAVASYDWLDFSVGEDTSGSGRRPAAANGCFQFRPTHDSVDLSGMKITIERFDTPIIHARDFDIINQVAPLWRKKSFATDETKTENKIRIIYPQDFIPKDQSQHLYHLEKFVADLELATGSTASRPNLASIWQSRPPSNMSAHSSSDSSFGHNSPGSESVSDYLRSVLVQTYYREYYRSQSEFRTSYSTKYNRDPYVNAFVKWRWDLGRAVTDAEYMEGSRRIDVYRSWLLNEIMKIGPSEGENSISSLSPSSLAIIVLPISEGVPNYRDNPPPSPSIQNGFDPLYLSPILAGPDLVIPIGEVEYQSRISGRKEMLPICVSVLGSPGMDQVFLDVIRKALVQSGRPLKVKTGKRMF